ncbi:MAG: leucine-rich repeat protein [Treponema sp.]|nr:leucine-rich repeat protein [Treponema sp.]
MKRHVLFIAGIFSLLTISGCKNIDSSEDESTNTGAYICIEAGAERTIKPSFTLEEMTYFSLYGKKTESDEETEFRTFSTYEDLLKGNFAVSTGNWYEFKLTAKNGNNQFVGTISNKEIVQGKNTLHFMLSLEEKSGYVGNVNVTFKIPSATAVKAAKAGLYTRDTDEEITGYGYPLEELSITPSEDSDSATAVYDYRADSGTYRLKAWFYADEDCTLLVGTFSELVKIIDYATSEAERDIRVNEVYTITLNDEGTYESSYTPKTLYTRYDNLIELPSAVQMKKSGYTFLGWYTSADGSGQPVTEISESQAENVVLYAKWYEGCAVSASTYKNANFASSEYGDTYTILLLGEWTDEEFSDFCSKLKGTMISFERSLTLDMSEITGVTTIGDYAFFNNIGTYSRSVPFVSVLLPDGITSIGKFAFERCSKLTEITIPEGVTSIDYYAFDGCSSLPQITIPEGVTSISDDAFSGCTSLAEIKIPDSVTSIGNCAFAGCSSLAKITIPDSVTSIGGRAFEECTSLTQISIPDGVTSIEWATFYGCTSLSAITIPEGVTSIDYSAFSGCSLLTQITIPEGVPSIGDNAFYGCSSLAQITIPDSVTSISESAFKDCNIDTLTIGAGVVSKAYTGDTALIKRIFPNCSTITISDGVENIGAYAFSGCTQLSTINIPDSVTSIGNSTFSGCTSLKEITIPDSVTSISQYAFYGCSSLTAITIPKQVTFINGFAFAGCSSLKEITIPNNVTKIGHKAFGNCNSLESVTLCGNLQVYSEGIGGISSDAGVFAECPLLTDITIQNGVTSIDSSLFSKCSAITKIDIPDSVTSIGKYVFYGCTSLSKITIPDGVTAINNYTFYNCSSLAKITIPKSVTKIGIGAFENSGIETVTFEDTTSSWYKTSNSDYTEGTSIGQRSNPSANATVLKEQYKDYYLYKE